VASGVIKNLGSSAVCAVTLRVYKLAHDDEEEEDGREGGREVSVKRMEGGREGRREGGRKEEGDAVPVARWKDQAATHASEYLKRACLS